MGIQVRSDEQIQQDAENKRMEIPMYRLMSEGEQSLYWKEIVKEIDTKILLNNSVEAITDLEDVYTKRGMVRAFKMIKTMPDSIKNRN